MASEEQDLLALHLGREPVHRALIRAQEHRLFSEVELMSPVLDIGCGDGHFAALAYPPGIDAGIDVTWPIVAEGRRHGSYRRVHVADGTRLPYPSAFFRTVVSNCVIEHIPDVESVICEAARVLQQGGRFIFSVPSEIFTDSLFTVSLLRRLGLAGPARLYGNWWNGHARHCHIDPPAVWLERLDQCGLDVERHTHYMSAASTRAFELSHYYAIPSIVWHRLTGRWSLLPGQAHRSLAYRWLRSYAGEAWPRVGACSFFVACKRSA